MGDIDVNIKVTKSGDGAREAVAEQQQLKLAVEETSAATRTQNNAFEDINKGLASSVKGLKSSADMERLRREEMEAGLATEREMIAEEKALAAAQLEQAAASEAAAFNTKGLGTAVSQLSRNLFGLGQIGRAIFNPMVLAIVLVVEAYGKAKRALNEWNEEMDKTIDKQREADALPGINARIKATREAVKAQQDFNYELDHTLDLEHEYKRQYDSRISAVKEQHEWDVKALEAERDLVIKKIDTDEAAGKIDAEEAARRKGDVEKGFRRKRDASESGEDADVVGIKEQELDEAQKRQQRLKTEEIGAVEKALDEKAAHDVAAERLDDAKKKLAEAKTANQNAENNFGNISESAARQLVESGDDPYGIVAQKLATLDDSRNNLGSQSRAVAGFQSQLDRTGDGAAKQVASLKRQQEENSRIINSLQDEIGELKQSTGIKERGQARVAGIQDQTAAAAAMLAEAREIAKVNREVAAVHDKTLHIILAAVLENAKRAHLSAADTEKLIREVMNNR